MLGCLGNGARHKFVDIETFIRMLGWASWSKALPCLVPRVVPIAEPCDGLRSESNAHHQRLSRMVEAIRVLKRHVGKKNVKLAGPWLTERHVSSPSSLARFFFFTCPDHLARITDRV